MTSKRNRTGGNQQGFVGSSAIYISFVLNMSDFLYFCIYRLLKAVRVEDILPSSLPWGCVTENTAPVRGSVTPCLCLYIGAFCPSIYSSPERQKQRFRFVTISTSCAGKKPTCPRDERAFDQQWGRHFTLEKTCSAPLWFSEYTSGG